MWFGEEGRRRCSAAAEGKPRRNELTASNRQAQRSWRRLKKEKRLHERHASQQQHHQELRFRCTASRTQWYQFGTLASVRPYIEWNGRRKASFRKRKTAEGAVCYLVRVGKDGRRITKTFSTKSAAETWAPSQEHAIETGEFQRPGQPDDVT